MSEFGLSRRQFVKGGFALSVLGSAAFSGCGGSESFAPGGGPLIPPPPAASMVQPPVLRSENGSLSTTFRIRYEDLQVPTPTGTRAASLRTWNGFIGGPTLRVKPGDKLVVELINELPPNTDPMPPDHNTPHHFNSINLHTHGLHVSPAQDDVLLSLRPGETYTYSYDIPFDHPCGTFWYHAHKHGATAMHLFSGMAGLLIVEGEMDNDPDVAAATDLDFVIQELNLGGYGTETDRSTVYQVPDYVKPGPFSQRDSFLLVNGEFQPTITVEPGRTFRLRVLNASVRQAMPLSIPGAKFSVLSQDGITMPEALFVDSITLAPANRADLLIRFDQAGSFQLVKGSFSTGGGNPIPSAVLANFFVQGEQRNMALPTILTTPAQLPTIEDSEVTERRDTTYAVEFTNGPIIGGMVASNFTIDGVRFDPRVINHTMSLDSVVEWTLINTSNVWHPHHIHINPFQVVAVSSPDPEIDGTLNGLPLTQPVWLDTVHIPPMGSVTLRQRYPDFTGVFVQHCHILIHEDIGMMQLMQVV